ncbi:MAG: fumarylacetoacetase [Quisquiliibacterium sp.]
MHRINETHAPELRSWVGSANVKGCDFPIQNLPFAVFRRRGSSEPFRGGVAIGDQVFDMRAVQASGAIQGEAAPAVAHAAASTLNGLMAMGPRAWSALRLAISRLLREEVPQDERLTDCLVPLSEVEYAVPARIGDYTDMYTSVHHATNVGRLFRPDNPLMPNFKWLPVGYHGRASSVGVSEQRFHRPRGQAMPAGAQQPVFGPCQRLDYELELGIWVGTGNALGEPLGIDEAERHIFGLCLLNDWSARDIQAWEYQPLGPFLSKSFATTISPWIVTMEALAPYRCAWTRDDQDPQPLPYLESQANRERGGFDIAIEAWIETSGMRERNAGPARLSSSNFRHAYWSIAQMLAHHTVGGCNLQPGDLIGTGTQSGPTPQEGGALIELTSGGRQALTLEGGETRTFLQDGDAVALRAWCEREGAIRIGFGECRGEVLPVRD